MLFLPLGFGISCLLQRKRFKSSVQLAAVLAVSSGLSFTIEVLQAFLPSRNPTLTDILSNSFGGFLGFLCFYLIHSRVFGYGSKLTKKRKECFSIKKLIVGFIGYSILIFLFILTLKSGANLSNWDKTFPLLLGNEKTGNRPWQGYISEVYVTSEALSDEEATQVFSIQELFDSIKKSAIASYRLTGKGNYPDQTGNLPDLFWQGQSLDIQDGKGAYLTSDHWLETTGPVTFLNQRIRETSQFTLGATIATADTTQTGPARIISLSQDPLHRNFTLGQEGNNLVFRLRMPLTGENGATPELIVANVFSNVDLHHLIITYDGSVIQFYIDQLQNSYMLKLSPEITLFRYLLWPFDNWRIYLNAFTVVLYGILFNGIIFIPLGSILGIILSNVRSKFTFYTPFIFGGILLPPLISEIILAGDKYCVKPGELIPGVTIITGAMMIVKLLSRVSRINSSKRFLEVTD